MPFFRLPHSIYEFLTLGIDRPRILLLVVFVLAAAAWSLVWLTVRTAERHDPDPPPIGINGKAVAALVLSLVWLYGLGSLAAVAFGHVALREIRTHRGQQAGIGTALAGLVIGYSTLAFSVVWLWAGWL